MKKENQIFCTLKVTEDFGTDPHPDPLVRGTDPGIRIRIRIRIKMSRRIFPSHSQQLTDYQTLYNCTTGGFIKNLNTAQ
jgi:hypothetical protein